MKTSTLHHTLSAAALSQGWSMAALTAETTAVAAMSAEISLDSNDGWVQALPDGQFSAVDGRPNDVPGGKWLMDAQAFAALKAYTPHQQGDLVVDYEHQTLNREANGQPAPASGFFSIDEVEYRPGKGLFAKPRWTDKAMAMLSAGEYRYFSLVFFYDKATGRPTGIHSGALTNRPGVDGMQPLAALMAEMSPNPTTPKPKEAPMNKALIVLLGLLGITVEDGAEPSEEQLKQAETAIKALKEKADKAPEEGKAALTAENVDLTKYVPVETYQAVTTQLAALSAQSGENAVNQAVDKAKGEGRILESEVNYFTSLGKQQGLAVLTAQLEKRPSIAALTAQQTTTIDKPKGKDPVAALSAEEKSVAKQLGLSHQEFAEAKAAQ